MRRAMLLAALVGCGGPAFTATQDSIRVEAGANEAAPDAGRVDEGGGSPTVDGGSEGESSTGGAEAGRDAAPEAEADAGADPLAACETYYRAYATGCSCRPPTDAAALNCGTYQYDDAGGLSCTRDDLNRCGGPGGSCGWDGAVQDYAQLCACVFACLGSCAPTNGLFFACNVAACAWSSCP